MFKDKHLSMVSFTSRKSKSTSNPTRCKRLENQGQELEQRTSSTSKPSTSSSESTIVENTPSSNDITSTTSHHTHPPRPIVRRKPTQPKYISHIKAMSLVGLKNIFFYQTFTTPKPANSNRQQGVPKFDFTASRQPLLASNGSSESIDRHHDDDESTLDLESQDSRSEKSSHKKGWRIDARVISDATIGLSDGLTVPFALTAGLSAMGDTKIVVLGGFAELIAGAISMGLGGYLGAKSEIASYHAIREETIERISSDLQGVMFDLIEVFEPYNIPKHTLKDLTTHLSQSPLLVDFVMQFQHCQEEPAGNRALTSALTIATGYFLGGLLPLLPYVFVSSVAEGLYISIGIMVIVLFIFGYVKTAVVAGFRGGKCIKEACFGGIQMVIVGSVAAIAAMGLVRIFHNDEGGMGF
ncbi:Protein ccc1 [Ciborinia camelliae]|nr:Protein ccc1 [Ciborinia camelliae]